MYVFSTLQLARLRFGDSSFNGFHSFGVGVATSSNDSLIGVQCATLGEIKRGAVHVGTDSTGFLDQETSRGVVPDLLLVVFTSDILGWDSETYVNDRPG